jgi:hypothetical protein
VVRRLLAPHAVVVLTLGVPLGLANRVGSLCPSAGVSSRGGDRAQTGLETPRPTAPHAAEEPKQE